MFEKYGLKWAPLWLMIGWMMIVTVIVLSLMPHSIDIPGEDSDKFGHWLAYGTMMFWFAQIYPATRTRLFVAIALALMGVSLEIAQSFGNSHTFEYADMAANSGGVLLGWLVAPPRMVNLLLLVERWI